MTRQPTDDMPSQPEPAHESDRDGQTPDPPPEARYAAWKGAMARTFPELDIIASTERPLAGVITPGQCGPVMLVRLAGAGHVLERSKAQIDRSPAEHPYFCWQRAEPLHIVHGDETDELRSGGFVIHDSNRPHSLHMERPFDLLCTQVPETLVRERTGASIGRWTGSLIDLSPSVHRIVAATMTGLTDRHETAADAETIGDLFIEVLGRGLAEKDRGDRAASPAGIKRAVALQRFVAAYAPRGAISPADAAAELGCSLRLIHATAACLGTTFGRMVLDARLDVARGRLDTELHSISEIAIACGFSDVSHFSRVFKARFGLSPRAYRAR